MQLNLAPFDSYFKIVIGVCLLMTLVSLARFPTRRGAAIAMAIAFAFFALEIQLLRSGASNAWLIAVGVIIFGSLLADIVLRSDRNRAQKDKGR